MKKRARAGAEQVPAAGPVTKKAASACVDLTLESEDEDCIVAESAGDVEVVRVAGGPAVNVVARRFIVGQFVKTKFGLGTIKQVHERRLFVPGSLHEENGRVELPLTDFIDPNRWILGCDRCRIIVEEKPGSEKRARDLFQNGDIIWGYNGNPLNNSEECDKLKNVLSLRPPVASILPAHLKTLLVKRENGGPTGWDTIHVDLRSINQIKEVWKTVRFKGLSFVVQRAFPEEYLYSTEGLKDLDRVVGVDGNAFVSQNQINALCNMLEGKPPNHDVFPGGCSLIVERPSPTFYLYEVALQWGDGCYFPEFQPSTAKPVGNAGTKPRGRRRISYASTKWRQLFDSKEPAVLFATDKEIEDALKHIAFKFTFARSFGCYHARNMTINITDAEIARVWPGKFLNDVLIDFYIGAAIINRIPALLSDRVYVYHSLFYSWLRETSRKSPLDFSKAYNRVATTTKNVNIFDKDVLVVPIHDDLHWTVALVCNPGLLINSRAIIDENQRQIDGRIRNQKRKKLELDMLQMLHQHSQDSRRRRNVVDPRDAQVCNATVSMVNYIVERVGEGMSIDSNATLESIEMENVTKHPGRIDRPTIIFMDSMKYEPRTRTIFETLRKYLEYEWNTRMNQPLECTITAEFVISCTPLVPQQLNSCDCGLYVLEFIERTLGAGQSFLDFVTKIKEQTGSKTKALFKKQFGANDWFEPVDIARKRHALARILASRGGQ